ncbi:hypothetical protein CLV59_10873 [Chitinophaga dinghuensis]|uniref:Uncharacterized protein n=1 Tax=Chitinophaga dinghuensis TaxID=1539050 RepID=A0A327VQ55_9BACT|nr:hypothetical protein [Chitinophaga dinghuensis]RAJ76554.1 hypothetical protein CLV59_10873 [Chitinophaga dinghuensis]
MAIQHRKEDYFERLIAEAFAAFNRLAGGSNPPALEDLEIRLNELLREPGLTLEQLETTPLDSLASLLQQHPVHPDVLELIADTMQYKASLQQDIALQERATWIYEYLLANKQGNSISYTLLMKLNKAKTKD